MELDNSILAECNEIHYEQKKNKSALYRKGHVEITNLSSLLTHN